MSSKTLIRGGCVLTFGAKTPNFAEADVLIDDGEVVEVGRGLRARDAEVVEAADTIVMPGFVDTHRHVWKSLLRNRGGDTAFEETVAPNYQPEDVYAATLIALLGAAEAGITTVADWSDIQTDDATAEATLQAHADAGLRTVLIPAAPSWSDGGDETRWFRLAEGDAAVPATTTIAAGGSEPRPGNTDRVAGAWETARSLGLRIHAHAGTHPESAGALADLGERGLLGSDTTLVHCTYLDDRDLDAVAAAGAGVALAPASDMACGLGAPPMQQLIDRGIRPGLAVDVETLAPGDLFAPMRAAISMQHATVFDRKLAGKGSIPRLLNTRDVVRYATIDGARAIGLDAVTGSLEPGKQADIVVLRTDRPNIFPVNDPIGAVVWGMDTSNLDWVFVAGRVLMRRGVLEGDVERARKLATAAQHRVATAAGSAVGTITGAER